jgi:8-oxo-dGTP pyrophosphatase MutT (NUDIX family)
MVRRHQDLAFMGGAHVFPGGRVDEADYVDPKADASWCDGFEHAVRQLPGIEPRLALAHHVAAVREVFEEAGVLLARDPTAEPGGIAKATTARLAGYRQRVLADAESFRGIIEGEGLRLALDSLVVCAHWVTPARLSRRFDTLFFAVRMPAGQTASHDNGETVESLWVAPRQASEKDLLLPPPTRVTLDEIQRFETVDRLLTWFPGRSIERREPL